MMGRTLPKSEWKTYFDHLSKHLIGERAEVIGGFDSKGTVRYGGELWNARSSLPLQAGQAVRIAKVEGLTVWVEPF